MRTFIIHEDEIDWEIARLKRIGNLRKVDFWIEIKARFQLGKGMNVHMVFDLDHGTGKKSLRAVCTSQSLALEFSKVIRETAELQGKIIKVMIEPFDLNHLFGQGMLNEYFNLSELDPKGEDEEVKTDE